MDSEDSCNIDRRLIAIGVGILHNVFIGCYPMGFDQWGSRVDAVDSSRRSFVDSIRKKIVPGIQCADDTGFQQSGGLRSRCCHGEQSFLDRNHDDGLHIPVVDVSLCPFLDVHTGPHEVRTHYAYLR